MTLLLTEMTGYGIVFAADRNITSRGLKAVIDRRPKILQIPHLHAVIGYFGNAVVGATPIYDWLKAYIFKSTQIRSIEIFARSLATDIRNSLVGDQRKERSGFHIAGFETIDGLELPTFWFVTNIPSMKGPFYEDARDWFEASNDFLGRDVRHVKEEYLMEYLKGSPRVYRNGTLTAYIVIADHLYSLFQTLWTIRDQLQLQGFTRPTSLEEYAALARFHVELTKNMYQLFGKYTASPIGGKIDVITITPDGRITEY